MTLVFVLFFAKRGKNKSFKLHGDGSYVFCGEEAKNYKEAYNE